MNNPFHRGLCAAFVVTATFLANGCMEDDAESGDLRSRAFYPETDIRILPEKLVIDTALYTEDDYRNVELTDGDTLEAVVAGKRLPLAQVSDGLYPAYRLVLPGNFSDETVRVILSRGNSERVSRVTLPHRLVIDKPADRQSFVFGDAIRLSWNSTAVEGDMVVVNLVADCERDGGGIVTRSGSLGKVINDGSAIVDFADFFRNNYKKNWNAFDGCAVTISVLGEVKSGKMDANYAGGHIKARARDNIHVRILP